ncbi:GNAT family N-acetyltransferase [Aeoliella mucimassa]|uniref:N-acyltransferase YncA n=1 Tax=Aeoliella mucimassa TaxID=2527972 RepID=A0A518AK82_9BACT|nr:GNAT family N-acetyltransferase [Aeoliella mucimassa]QDU55141.1 N-acyltransferase YncA [Aeoliella mucimassa]
MSSPLLRLATEADLAAINDIHNHYVVNTTSTYALEPMTLEARRAWFTNRAEIHPVTVVERDDRIVAWGALGVFRLLAGYRTTAENSVYVHPDFVRQKLGSMILADQTRRAVELGLHSIIAVIDSEKVASIEAHRKHGFKEIGRLMQVARKFDKFQDAMFMQWLPSEPS